MINSVSFKGTREGLLITLGEGVWHDLLNELGTQLSRPSAQAFFSGARVQLDNGNRPLEVMQLEELIALLSQHGMTLTSVMGERESQEAFDRVQATLPPPPESLTRVNEDSESALPAGTALLIRRTVRSGQVVRHAGTIVVIGDVNPGAEVIAEGDIIVWGKLRGVVHAGASGNEESIIGALLLMPTQLRISGYITRSPDDKKIGMGPEIARVREQQIVVEPWSG